MMKILILEANPHKDLSLDKEIRSLRSVIDDAGDRNKFHIKDGAKVRKDQLQKLMLDFEAEDPEDEPIIVHFCGHGTGEKGYKKIGQTWTAFRSRAGYKHQFS